MYKRKQEISKNSTIIKAIRFRDKLFSIKIISDIFQAIFEFLLSLLLSRATILGNMSPFGLAFISAQCGFNRGFFAIIGSFLGYFSVNTGIYSIKYLTASILTIAAAYIVRDFKFFEKKVFMPCTTALSISFTGIMFLINAGFSFTGLVLLLSEILITGILTFFYIPAIQNAQNSNDKMHFGGKCVLFGSVLISLYPITILDILSPARLIALITVLIISYIGGFMKGSSVGVAMGMILDAAAGITPFFTCTFGFCALISGVFNQSGRVIFVCIYIISNATVSLLGIDDVRFLSGIYESILASALFILIPHNVLQAVRIKMQGDTVKSGDYIKKMRETAKKYANDACSAFNEMYMTMSKTMPHDAKPRRIQDDISAVFDSAANQICKKCVLCSSCWEKDYMSTISALNDATNAMIARGRAVPEDFPIHFSARCIKFPSFLIYINEGLATLLARSRYKEKLQDNKILIAEQYAGITSVLRQIAYNLSDSPEFIPLSERKLRKYAEAFGNISTVTCYRDPSGHIRAELTGDGVYKIMEQAHAFSVGLSGILDVKFTLPEQICDSEGVRVILKQKENYHANIGVGMCQAKGSLISGDTSTYFITDYGKAYMLLCDGMGTGAEAYAESKTALRLIERFLRAGISPEEALRTITPAIKLRHEQSSFVTIDIAQIDLFTCACEIYKCGAAPTYIVSKNSVKKITSNSMPAGINEQHGKICDITKLKLSPDDLLVMVSDGVSDGLDDNELVRLIQANNNSLPREIAAKLIEHMQNNKFDDKTSLVMKLCANE